MSRTKTVVITGSTRGIGYGMAKEVLARGHQVVVCGRSQESTDAAVASLAESHDAASICGAPCDVGDIDQVEALWDAAVDAFGKVDIWVNNAGLSSSMASFWELPASRIEAVVRTNLLGTMYSAKVAIPRMKDQGFGAIYNMEGFGSDGRKMAGMTLYGTTKYGIRYYTESMIKEAKDTPVLVGTLSPGMVITDMLIGDYDKDSEEWEKTKKLFNILADTTDTVCPWLVERFLSNDKHGAAFRWLTTPGIILRFLMAPFRKRDLFASDETT